MPKHIALFGGSFDPPHLGHLALVEAALAHLNIDECWLLPVGVPVHKALSGHASAEQRLTWLKQMFSHEKRVLIVDWEVNNPKPSPAIDSLRHFKARFPQLTPTWLMGADSFADLPNWVDYPQHQSLCNIAIFQRKGHETPIITNTWKEVSIEAWQQQTPLQPGHVITLQADLPEASSTAIRRDVLANKSLLSKSTCNAILACYASPLMKQEREDT